jgi:uncharacterized OsmC-like protein
MADSGCFGLGELGGVTRFEEFLEADPQGLAFDPQLAARTARLESDEPDGLVPTAITPGITFRLAERPQSSHGRTVRRRPDGSSASPGRIGTVPTGAKEFRYAVALDRAGRVTADGHASLDLDPAWTPEHLVLAGLVRCTLQSLRFHSEREGIDFVASAAVSGLVTRRPEDGRYAFVDLDVQLDLELEPMPPGDELAALLAKAERDCFVGASLKPSPRYRWRVNGTAF